MNNQEIQDNQTGTLLPLDQVLEHRNLDYNDFLSDLHFTCLVELYTHPHILIEILRGVPESKPAPGYFAWVEEGCKYGLTVIDPYDYKKSMLLVYADKFEELQAEIKEDFEYLTATPQPQMEAV